MSYRLKSKAHGANNGFARLVLLLIHTGGRLSLFVGTPLIALATPIDSSSTATRIEFVLISPALASDSVSARAKVMYLAGRNYARIEQPTDAFSSRRNLIIVNNRDVWIVDARTETGKHQINHDPDFAVHNPILGPNCPISLRKLEYGHETEFVNGSNATFLARKRIGSAECNLYETKSDGYRIRFYIHATTRCPVLLEVFTADETVLHINYLNYQTGLPFDTATFSPPKGITFLEENN